MRQRFEKEREKGGPIKMICVVERTAIPPESGSTRPDSFDKVVIRRVVHGFYLRKEYPTLSKVLGKVKEACSFPGGKFCLWRILREKVFAYIKRDRKRFIYKQEHVHL